jgi:SPP1 family predicted phage head-tail adaptor
MKLKDKKIRIIEYFHSTDDHGFSIDEWRPLHGGRLWAYYRQLSGSEFYASAMVNVAEEVVFTINYRADVTTEMLIEFSGKFYEITRIDNFEGYKDDLNIYCKLSADQNIEVVEPQE